MILIKSKYPTKIMKINYSSPQISLRSLLNKISTPCNLHHVCNVWHTLTLLPPSWDLSAAPLDGIYHMRSERVYSSLPVCAMLDSKLAHEHFDPQGVSGNPWLFLVHSYSMVQMQSISDPNQSHHSSFLPLSSSVEDL